MPDVRRGTLLSFSSTDWTALVMLEGADVESQIPVGQWVPSGMMVAASEVAVLVFGSTDTDDAIVLGPYGAVSLWDYPALSGLTTGQALRATGALAAAFGALDLANAAAVTGILPQANYIQASGSWTPAFIGSAIAGTFTYTNQIGTYTQLGGLVFFTGRVTISAISGAPTGTMSITGLPVTSAATYNHGVAWGRISNFKYTAASLGLIGRIANANTVIVLEEAFSNAVFVTVPATNFTNAACDLIFSGFYKY